MKSLRNAVQSSRRLAERLVRKLTSFRDESWQPSTADEAFQNCLNLAKAGNLQDSLDRARTAQKKWPNDHRLHRPEARALVKLGQATEAMEVLKRLEKLEPDLVQIENLRRAIYRANISSTLEQGALEDSLSFVQEALEIWPDLGEHRRTEIRLLIQLGHDKAGLERVQDFEAMGLLSHERIMNIVHNAIRNRQAWLGEHGAYETAVSSWFIQAKFYPELPRSSNTFVDNCLAAQAQRRKDGPPEQDRSSELDLMDQLYAGAANGQAAQTRDILDHILSTMQPLDWLPRYLKLFYREMNEQDGITALQTVGSALLALDGDQIDTLFVNNPPEVMALSAILGTQQVIGNDPDLAKQLAALFLSTDISSTGRARWAQIRRLIFEDEDSKDETLATQNFNRAVRTCVDLIRIDDFETALTCALEAQKTWPDEPRLIRHEVRALVKLGQAAEAIEVLKRLEKLEPDLAQIESLRRAVYRANIESDPLDQGLDWARKAIEIWPDVEEYRRAEIRLLSQLERHDEALVQARALDAIGDADDDGTTLVYNALRDQMVQSRDKEAWEHAITMWFKLAQLSPERPRSPNAVVDMCLAAQVQRRKDGPPEQDRCDEVDLMDQLYAASTAGQVAQTRDILAHILTTVQPLDWLPRYLKMFYREMDEQIGVTALQTVGGALPDLDKNQIDALFASNPPEIMAISAILGTHQVIGNDPDLAKQLAALFLSTDITSTGRSRWKQIRQRIFEGQDSKDKKEAAQNLNKVVRACVDLIRIDDFETALNCALEGQKNWPNEPRLILHEARALVKLGKAVEAMEALRRLEYLDPDLTKIESLRRTIYRANISHTYEQGALEDSLSFAQEALQIWPDIEEYRRAEIRLLIQLGHDTVGFERVQAFEAMDLLPRERIMSIVHNAIRNRQAWLGERGAYETAVSSWFIQAKFYPELPRSPNTFVDNCLAAQALRRKDGPPEQGRSSELDLMDQLYAGAASGQVALTRDVLATILDNVQPNDWLPRYLKMFHREMEPKAATIAIATLGHAVLGLTPTQAELLFTTNPAEATSFITTFGRGSITVSDPNMGLDLADLCLAALGPSTLAYSIRANVNFQRENFQESHDDIAKALALDPYAFAALQTEFTLLATSGRHEDAARRLDELTASGKIDPTKLAQLASKGQMTTDARILFQKAIEADPTNKALISAHIKFCYHNGHWGHCLAEFERAPLVRKGHPLIAKDVYDLAAQAGMNPQDIAANPAEFLASPTAFRLALDQSTLHTPTITPNPAALPGKRAAIVIGSLGPGGAERQCSVLVRTLARNPEAYGISKLQVFCTNLTQSPKNSFLLEDIREVGIEPVEYFSRDRNVGPSPEAVAHILPRSRAQVILQMRDALQAFQPDVIHGILNETIVNAGLAALHLGGTRLVGRWGSLPPGQNRQVSQRADDNNLYLQSAYRDLIARHPNAHFYSNATEATQAYETWLGQPKNTFSTIYNGIEADKFAFDPAARADIRTSLGIDPDTVVIGTAFRFTEEKRPFKWLEVARAVSAQTISKVAFIILGNGPLLIPSQRYAKELGLDNIHFMGRQSDIGRWWSAMDIGLMTSSVEGISNTVIEAQLLGRPVVAFDVGGMPEAIEDGITGKLFTDDQEQDMVAFLVGLAENPARLQAMGKEATAFALRQFSAEMLAKNTAALY